MLWLRKDLMEKAGVDKIPQTWDELRAACQAMQGGGIYGAPLPYAKNSMTTLTIIGFIHLAGGTVFSPDLDIALDSQETRTRWSSTLDARTVPAGRDQLLLGREPDRLRQRRTATGIYTGRVLINVNTQNPPICRSRDLRDLSADFDRCRAWTFNDFPSVFIPKAAANMEATKAFAAFLYRPGGLYQAASRRPGPRPAGSEDHRGEPGYQDNAIIEKYPSEVELMSSAAAAGYNLGWESAPQAERQGRRDRRIRRARRDGAARRAERRRRRGGDRRDRRPSKAS